MPDDAKQPSAALVDKENETARTPQASRFNAFISYSRSVDAQLTRVLQSGLQRFAKPWYRLRVLHVFRDDASLSANPGLWSSIERALDSSSFLILLSSPPAAGSKWVQREVEHWRETKDGSRILLALTEGEIVWDESSRDFDWKQTTALPPALSGAFAEEPRWVDLRWARTDDHLTLRDPRFREAVADLAAPIHGRPKDELIGEEVRQHRRTLRIARTAGVVLALLTAAAVLFGVLALRARNDARAKAQVALSRQLAAESETSVTNGRLDLGLLLGAQAYRMSRTPEARSALANALIGSSHVTRLLTDEPLVAAAASFGGKRIALARRNGQVVVWDVLAGHRVGKPASLSSRPDVVALSGDGRRLALGAVVIRRTGGTNIRFPSVAVWDVDRSRWIVPVGKIGPSFGAAINDVAVSGGGSRVAWWDGRPGVVEIGVWNGRSVSSIPGPFNAVPCEVLLNVDGSLLASVESTGAVQHMQTEVAVWKLSRSGVVPREPAVVFRGRPGYAPNASGCAAHGSAAFDPKRPGVLALGGWNGTVTLWDAGAGVQLGRALRTKKGVVSKVAFSPDGGRLLARDAGGLTMWNLADRRELPVPLSDSASDLGAWLLADHSIATVGNDGNLAVTDERASAVPLASRLADRVGEAAFSPQGGLLGAVDAKGVVRFWSTGSWRPSEPPIATGLAGARFAFSKDGRRLVAWSPQAGRAAIWELATRRLVRYIDAKAGDQLLFDAHDRVLALATGYSDTRVADTSPKGSTSTLHSSPDTTAAEIDPSSGTMLLSTLWGTGVWDLRSGRRTSAWFPTGAAAWNPARKTLATGERDGTLEVWDIRTGALRSAFRSLPAPLAVRFSPDGAFLAVLGDGLQVWDLARQSLLGSRPFSGDLVDWHVVANLDFSPSNDALVASGPNGELVRWNLDPRNWLQLACGLADRHLTRAEWSRLVGARRYAPAC